MQNLINKMVVATAIILAVLAFRQDLTIKDSSFAKSLKVGEYILDAPDGWWHWCMAPIYDESGKLHVFMSAILNSGSWNNNSKIVHYTAAKPEGAWKESPHNPIIQPSYKAGDAHELHASNPTFVVDKEGKYRIYYKSISGKNKPNMYREISLAISDNIEGPYKNYPDNPLLSYADLNIDIEDPYAFYYKGMYYMIVEDRMGVKNALEGNPIPAKEIKAGGNRPGLIYQSKDGIR